MVFSATPATLTLHLDMGISILRAALAETA
jgi:hypothetical protein